MSKLISGKEAKLAWANGEQLEVNTGAGWEDLTPNYCLSVFDCRFPTSIRLKPRTITINGIEVPAPFEPNSDVEVYILDDAKTCGYKKYMFEVDGDINSTFIGIWRTEEEIKQVVAALRQVFKGEQA